MPKLTVGKSALEGDNSDSIVGEGGGPGEAVDRAVLPDGKQPQTWSMSLTPRFPKAQGQTVLPIKLSKRLL